MFAVEELLREAAFGEVTDVVAGSETLVTDRTLAVAAAGPPRCRWLAAVVLGARGRYAAAAALLEPLRRGADPLVAALAGAALASHRRQLGGHAIALPLDGAALRHAVVAAGPREHLLSGGLAGRSGEDEHGLDPPGALADALLGLAADNLALGRLSAAKTLLARAVTVRAGWRAEVRLGWVSAELALASGRASDSVSPAKRAADIARDRGATRHSIKSDLVLGAALAATGERANRDRAAGLVAAALEAAEERGLRSLTWPARLLAADLDPERADWNRSRVTEELHALLPSTDPVGRRCARGSPWLPI